MEVSNSIDQAEARSTARALAAAFKTVKALDDVLPFFGRNAGPSVSYNQDCTTGRRLPDLNGDHIVAGPVFYRIIQEVGERVEQEIAVSSDGERLSIDHMDQCPFRMCHWLE